MPKIQPIVPPIRKSKGEHLKALAQQRKAAAQAAGNTANTQIPSTNAKPQQSSPKAMTTTHNTSTQLPTTQQLSEPQSTADRLRKQGFQKGHSGNPSGLSGASIDARKHAQRLAPKAFRALERALTRPGERVAASTAILDRAYGKVAASTTVRVIHSIQDLSDAELRAIVGDTERALVIDASAADISDDDD